MRAITSIVALLTLAGCTTSTNENASPLDVHPQPAQTTDTHLALKGTYWIPPSLGLSTAKGSIPFALNATQLSVTIYLRVGTRAAGVEAPASSAMVLAKLVDSSNKTVAEAMIMPPEKEARIETANASAGGTQLVLETHGGSDGKANGDYVAYEITAAPRQA